MRNNSTEFALNQVVLTKIMLQDLELLTLATLQLENVVPVDYTYSHLFELLIDNGDVRQCMCHAARRHCSPVVLSDNLLV